MKKHIKWFIFHIMHWAVLYGAFVLELNGALRVLQFFVWVMLPIAFILLSDRSVKLAVKDKPAPFRSTMTVLQRWSTLLLLVWNGHIATAIAWGFVMGLIAIHREKVRNLRDAPEIRD